MTTPAGRPRWLRPQQRARRLFPTAPAARRRERSALQWPDGGAQREDEPARAGFSRSLGPSPHRPFQSFLSKRVSHALLWEISKHPSKVQLCAPVTERVCLGTCLWPTGLSRSVRGPHPLPELGHCRSRAGFGDCPAACLNAEAGYERALGPALAWNATSGAQPPH